MTSYLQQFSKLSDDEKRDLLIRMGAEKEEENPTYTDAPVTYDPDTATQSPSLASDLATNRAIQHALKLESYTGDPYPMIDLGAKDPFSFSANQEKYEKDQDALEEMTGGRFGGEIRYPEEASTHLNPNPDPVVVPGTETKEDVVEEVIKGGGRKKGPPGFDEPERMQARGQHKMDTARSMLQEAESRKARQRARKRLQEGHAMRKQGRIAEAFRDVGERRDERLQAGAEVGRQNQKLDRRFGAALKSFGSDVASEIAGTYSADRYGTGRREMSDEAKAELISVLEKRKAAKEGARIKSGGKRVGQIEGEGKVAEKKRAAAERAKAYNMKINRDLGRASRRYGAEDVSAIAQSLGIGKYSA